MKELDKVRAFLLEPSQIYILQTSKSYSQVLSINLRAQIIFTRAELKAMLSKPSSQPGEERGVIINWASILSSIAIHGENPAYIAAKHAIVGLTRSTAAGYGKDGIRCNAVAPG
jgi:NAD(P)-dependent dehydrogenase (short-subunit alcohol dehydrogenase family)